MVALGREGGESGGVVGGKRGGTGWRRLECGCLGAGRRVGQWRSSLWIVDG